MSVAGKSTPRVAVLMSVYNGAAHLREAVDSILAQSYENFELIVVDDGSTDDTPAILGGYRDPRLRVLRQTNAGLTAALNSAFATTDCELIARQDADDVSAPGRLAAEVAFLDEHPEVGVVGCWAEVIDAQGERLGERRPLCLDADIAGVMPRENQFIHGSIMVRGDLLRSAGGYREAFRYAQDYDLLLRLLDGTRMANIGEILYRYRYGGGQLSVTQWSLQKAYGELARRLHAQRAAEGSDDLERGVAVEELLVVEAHRRPLSPHMQTLYLALRGGNASRVRRESLALLRGRGARPRVFLYLLLSLLGGRAMAVVMGWWDRVRGNRGPAAAP
jgi:hypothetical protein